MADDRDRTGDGHAASGPAPLPYESPGAQGGSQWITDDGPGGTWLVGCLVVLSVLGAIGAIIVGLIGFFLGF